MTFEQKRLITPFKLYIRQSTKKANYHPTATNSILKRRTLIIVKNLMTTIIPAIVKDKL